MKLQLTRPLVTLDIESTGVDAEKDKIIELCLLKRYPDGTTEIRTRRFNPGIAIPQEVIDIHGITDEMVKDEPEFKVFAKSILSWLQGCDIAFFGGNNFDDNNYIFGAKAHSSRSVGGMQATCSVNRTTKLILF